MKLQAVMELRRHIEREENLLEVLRARAGTPPTAKLDGLPKAKATASRTEILAVKISDAERELERLREEETETILNLAIRISERVKATNTQKILILRYIEGLKFAEIAAAMNYSEEAIYYLHRRGVKEFAADDGTT